jgi:hypothetical protein
MSPMSNTADKVRRAYYALGLLYYLHHWFTVAGVAGVTISAVLHYEHWWRQSLPYVFSLSAVLLTSGLSLWWKARKGQANSHNPGLYPIQIECVYSVLGNNNYRYSRSLTVRALHSDVDHYRSKFTWTGLGQITASATNPNHQIRLFDEQYGCFRVCEVHFERPLRRKEEITFTYNLDFVDEAQAARPFLSHMAEYPIGRVILRVRFPDDGVIRECKQLTFESRITDMPVSERDLPLPMNSNEVSWDIRNPRLGCKYLIRW